METTQHHEDGQAGNRKNDEGVYILSTKGYKEQFSSLDSAKRAYGSLKRKKMAEDESFKIELKRKKPNGDLEVLEEVQITVD